MWVCGVDIDAGQQPKNGGGKCVQVLGVKVSTSANAVNYSDTRREKPSSVGKSE